MQALNKSLSTVSILAGLVASWMTAESITHSSWPARVLIFIHPRLPALKAYIKELDTRAYPATREARCLMLRDVAWFCKMCSLRFGNACRRQAMVGVSCAFSHSAVPATPRHQSHPTQSAQALLRIPVAWQSSGPAAGLRAGHHGAKCPPRLEHCTSTLWLVIIVTVFA